MSSYQTYLQRDVLTVEERAVILWKMASAIYEVHATAHRNPTPFGALDMHEKEVWVQCARAALRAMLGLDCQMPDPLPIEV